MRSILRLPTIATSVLLLALAVLLVACDADDAADPDEVAEDPGDAGQDAPEVATRALEFDPATLTVEGGTTVTWTNEDDVEHTVTSGAAGEPDGAFDEPLPVGGDPVELTFDEPGSVIYHCTIHPDMVGRIEVR